jgi:hypothetical protein
MRKTAIFSFLVACLFAPAIARAQSVFSDTYVIPAVSHAVGAHGTKWMSDVAITNFQSTPLTVQLIVVESGENNSDNIFPLVTDSINGSVTVNANSTLLLKDILNGYRGKQNVTGALILWGDRPFAVTSRSYTPGTIGQTVTPARDFFENSTGRSDDTAVAILPGLVNNAQSRTNIGFLAGTGSAAGQPMTIQVTVRDASGASLGTMIVSVGAGNFTHTQFSVASITATPFDIGSAELRILQGSGAVVPYASVIDNTSGAAAYIMGQFPASTPLAKTSSGLNVFSELLNRMSGLQ